MLEASNGTTPYRVSSHGYFSIEPKPTDMAILHTPIMCIIIQKVRNVSTLRGPYLLIC